LRAELDGLRHFELDAHDRERVAIERHRLNARLLPVRRVVPGNNVSAAPLRGQRVDVLVLAAGPEQRGRDLNHVDRRRRRRSGPA
jgi:hypothetical protein